MIPRILLEQAEVSTSVVMNRVRHLLVTKDFSNFEMYISKCGKAVLLWFGFSLVFKGCVENLESGLEYTSKTCIGITDF